jgi:uncharacterized protein YhaN
LSSLFGEGRPVSRHFARVTGGRYRRVELDPGRRRLRVVRYDEEPLEESLLSGGTRDQLFLALRLAVAEGVLGGERGFFVMDDPLVKADDERLREQLALFLELAREGWQILYFSAKREVREALEDLGASVQVIEMSPLVPPPA